jgi:hypothetical protein
MIERKEKIKILFVENASILVATTIFVKLVVFNHYKRLNIPIKLACIMFYFVIIDPLAMFSGYYSNRWFSIEGVKPNNVELL